MNFGSPPSYTGQTCKWRVLRLKDEKREARHWGSLTMKNVVVSVQINQNSTSNQYTKVSH